MKCSRIKGFYYYLFILFCTCALGMFFSCCINVNATDSVFSGWWNDKGKSYWYEEGIRQGTASDRKCFSYEGTLRGREIYDPDSDGWYWLDVNASGAKAAGKEVFMPYIYQDEDKWTDEEKIVNSSASDEGLSDYVLDCIRNKTGKWVRYDENGKMLKGWVEITGTLASLYPEQAGNVYYYDNKTGLMAKGILTIEGVEYEFDSITGALLGITIDEARRQVLNLVNEERAKVGVAPLTLNAILCERADIRATEIAEYMSHTRPDGTNCDTVASDLQRSFFGENIAGGQTSSEEVMNAWMNSPGHKANILKPQYTQLGVGLYYDSTSWGWHWVQLFIG